MGMQNRTAKGTDNNKEETRRKQTQEPDVQNNDTGAMNMDITPGIHDHAAILSRMQSDEQRARLTLQLQRSYGNSYVQHILNTAGGPTEQIISRNTPLRPTAPPPGTQEQEQIETSNIPPAPAPPRAARPGSAQQSAAEQIESSNVQPVSPAPATAPGTAEQRTAPGTGPAVEQEVSPGTAVTPEGPNAATGVASPLSPSQTAIRAVWANQVSNRVRNAYNSLIGSGTEEERATDARNYLNDAMNVIPTIRDAYQNDPDLFGQIAYAQASLEGWIAAVSPIAGYNITLESIADVINPSENNGRFAAINNIGERL
jgi:hypothetical protein